MLEEMQQKMKKMSPNQKLFTSAAMGVGTAILSEIAIVLGFVGVAASIVPISNLAKPKDDVPLDLKQTFQTRALIAYCGMWIIGRLAGAMLIGALVGAPATEDHSPTKDNNKPKIIISDPQQAQLAITRKLSV